MSKSGRPNLSLAGKREAPSSQKQSRGGGAQNRGGGRGRGRGRGAGPRQKQELIQTGGVFSEGLGGEFPTRKKNTDADGAQFSYSRRENVAGGASSSTATAEKKEEKKVPMNMEGKASFQGWDELWRSDDEGDEEELNALHPKGFISNLKRGTIMPVVLPLEDQPQFLNVINKSARLALEEDDEIDEKKYSVDAVKSDRQTAEQLIAMLESSNTDFLHLQLPSVVGSICNKIEQQDETPMEVDDPNNEIPSGPAPAPTPRFSLPESRRIGKLQVTRKGRLLLKIGGHSIDISSKPMAGKQQGTVLLEVDQTAESQSAPSPFSAPARSVQNSLYHLGNVKHTLVGSMTWSQLNEKKANSEKEKQVCHMELEVNGADGEVVKRVEQLKNEQAEWGELAEQWARGLIAH
ncbi:unnamed protein product [Caenorhabditis sp. 36 PRJEB53466]|nr:unnamed protein product [Caenorhabditis sp. 36 PRJEB53466]